MENEGKTLLICTHCKTIFMATAPGDTCTACGGNDTEQNNHHWECSQCHYKWDTVAQGACPDCGHFEGALVSVVTSTWKCGHCGHEWNSTGAGFQPNKCPACESKLVRLWLREITPVRPEGVVSGPVTFEIEVRARRENAEGDFHTYSNKEIKVKRNMSEVDITRTANRLVFRMVEEAETLTSGKETRPRGLGE